MQGRQSTGEIGARPIAVGLKTSPRVGRPALMAQWTGRPEGINRHTKSHLAVPELSYVTCPEKQSEVGGTAVVIAEVSKREVTEVF